MVCAARSRENDECTPGVVHEEGLAPLFDLETQASLVRAGFSSEYPSPYHFSTVFSECRQVLFLKYALPIVYLSLITDTFSKFSGPQLSLVTECRLCGNFQCTW